MSEADTEAAAGGLRRVVIIGDGVAAWMAAAALSDTLDRRTCSITVAGEARKNKPESLGADTVLPPAAGDRPGILRNEDELLIAGGGAFGWGIALGGWADRAAAWFHPFGSIGANLGPVPFHQLVMRLRQEGMRIRLADYSLAALAAQAGRFTRPANDARSVLSTCRYALHLDTAGLAASLCRSAEAAGVTRAPAIFQCAELADDGCIARVRTDDGQPLEADLFLDCTQAGALPGCDDWQDWSDWLACDRSLTTRAEARGMPPPYSHAEAHAAGWTRHLPLARTTVLSAFYCAAAGGEQAARASLRRAAGDAALAYVESAPVRFGRRREAWQGNHVVLGPAAAAIDPVAIGGLQLLQGAIARLLELLPGDPRQTRAAAREYNRRTAMELDNARDYAIALYKTNGRRGEAFWEDRRAMRVPDSLDYRMRLYGSLGRVALNDEEPLEDASWISLFDEQGPRPLRHHALADGFTRADLEAHVARVRAIMIEELKKMPAHGHYLDRLRARTLVPAVAGEMTP